jgi:hypothetical protein
MDRWFYSLIVLALLFLTGCVTSLQTKYAWSDKMYQGPFKEQDQIAILVQNEKQLAHLEKINGSQFKKDIGVVYELLPGHYQLCVGLLYIQGSYKHYSKECQNMELSAQAGHIYEFSVVEDNYRRNWHPVVRDITEELKDPSRAKEANKIEAMLQNARNKFDK